MKTKAKYKTGDYIAGERTVAIEVCAVLEGSEVIYGVIDHATTEKKRCEHNIHWITEYEADTQELKPYIPDFALWDTLEAGDMIKAGDHPRKVLCRIDNLVLLSETPPDARVKKEVHALAEQLDQLLDGSGELVEIADKVTKPKPHQTVLGAQRSAISDWLTIHDIALRNWRLLRE